MRCDGCEYYSSEYHPSCSMWKTFEIYWSGEGIMESWNQMKNHFDKFVTEHYNDCENYINNVSKSDVKIKIDDYLISESILIIYIRVLKALDGTFFFHELEQLRRKIHNEIIKESGLKRFTDEGREFNIALDIWLNENGNLY